VCICAVCIFSDLCPVLCWFVAVYARVRTCVRACVRARVCVRVRACVRTYGGGHWQLFVCARAFLTIRRRYTEWREWDGQALQVDRRRVTTVAVCVIVAVAVTVVVLISIMFFLLLLLSVTGN
jgi:hypothetical protein